MGNPVNSPAGPCVSSSGNLAGNIDWYCKRGFLDKKELPFYAFQEGLMVLKNLFIAVIGVAALAWSGLSAAQQYRADEFLGLDLSRAVLSPKPLGPATSFTPGPLDVTIDRGSNAVQANTESVVEPKSAATTATVHAENKPSTRTTLKTAASGIRAAHKPRAFVALHGRNPVEAQAREMTVQVWPCKSGGICNWKR
jgi:hypothetical protein